MRGGVTTQFRYARTGADPGGRDRPRSGRKPRDRVPARARDVAARIEESERIAIAQKAAESWETMHFASAEDDTEVWKELFGPRFRVED